MIINYSLLILNIYKKFWNTFLLDIFDKIIIMIKKF